MNENDAARSKRRHDLLGAIRTLKYTLEGLRKGYRYDDANAEAKIEALAKAIGIIERETALVVDASRGE